MFVRLAPLVAISLLPLAACSEQPRPDEKNTVSIRLYGEGKVGQACEAQSQCGYQQRCVYRGKDMGLKSLVVEKGVCESQTYPGGCFGLLPPYRFTEAERAKMRRDGLKGVPVHVICE